MKNESTHLVLAQHKPRRTWSRRTKAVELQAVPVEPDTHYTRVWSATAEAVPVLFRLCVLPVRALALFVLWATSSPQRLAIAVLLTAVVSVLVLV